MMLCTQRLGLKIVKHGIFQVVVQIQESTKVLMQVTHGQRYLLKEVVYHLVKVWVELVLLYLMIL